MYYVYILTTQSNRTLYVGVTNDLNRRLSEHKNGEIEGYTKRYHVSKLVHYETFPEVNDAIAREKQLKHWTRAKKNALIESQNPLWSECNI